MGRLRRTGLSIVLAVVVFVFGMMYVPKIFGYRMFTVVSESMEPTLYRGDVVFGYPISKLSDVSKGDVIVYTTSDKQLQRIIHRVVYKDTMGVYTLGDNNIKKDSLVTESQLLCKVDYKVPLMGYLVLIFVEHKFLVIIGSVLFVLLSERGKAGRDEETVTEDSRGDTKSME